MERLLGRYNQPAPRYTSYPPIPHWHAGVGANELKTALEESLHPLSIYVHIPFCRRLCLYCGCNTVITRDPSIGDHYVSSLLSEMDLLPTAHGRTVTQIHWGGGSPTFLTPASLIRLARAIEARFAVSKRAEISIEIDPRTTSTDQIQSLADAGFNRFSIGIQDFDQRVQKSVNRIQSYEVTERLIRSIRALNRIGVNVDIIYGLPFQTFKTFQVTLRKVISLDPDRIAVFSYAHVPSLKAHQRALERHLPSEEDKLTLFQTAIHMLTSAGYDFIGMDHFAKLDDPLSMARHSRTLHRNFQGYTTKKDTDLVGFGVSSISSVREVYTQNVRDLSGYDQSLTEHRLPTFRGYRRTEDDRIRGDVIERILCHNVVVKSEIEAAFGIAFDSYFEDSLERLHPLEDDGLVRMSTDAIEVTPTGRFYIRVIARAFDAFQPAPVAARVV